VVAQKKSNVKNDRSPVVWLVHPGAGESHRVTELVGQGYRVVGGPWSSPAIIRRKAALPSAVVIDLSRSPSAGRDIAVAMRSNRELLKVPFMLVEGAPPVVAAIKKLLPDAVETTWRRIRASLLKASASPPSGGRKLSVFAAYQDKPLTEKLGIKPGFAVVATNQPRGFTATLGALPDGARIDENPASARDLTLWFVGSMAELTTQIVKMKPHAASGRLWIIWRKGAVANSDPPLNQKTVRAAALDRGLVDFKITRIDAEWAGLRFTIRK
jgi:hypothetical protein